MDIDTLFKGMAGAPIFGSGNYMGEGAYLVETTRMFVKPRAVKGGTVFICEFRILESTNPKHVVGTTGSWVPKVELPNTFGDIKSLMLSILGVDPKSVGSTDPAENPNYAEALAQHAQAALLARAACGSETAKAELAKAGVTDEIWLGQRVRLECSQITTRDGHPFTKHVWSPAEAEEESAP